MSVIRLLLADDHVLFREGLVQLLREETDFEVVGEAGNGEEALQKARELMPDVILMDVSMPIMDGIETTHRIKEELPYVKIVMLSASDEDSDLFEAIKSGAQGYLLKTIESSELIAMLKGISDGEAPISRSTASRILGELSKQSQSSAKGEFPQDKLSPREQEVLRHLTVGETNKEIALSLGISENTVKNHLKNILEKLHLKNRVEAAAYALRKGYEEKPTSRI